MFIQSVGPCWSLLIPLSLVRPVAYAWCPQKNRASEWPASPPPSALSWQLGQPLHRWWHQRVIYSVLPPKLDAATGHNRSGKCCWSKEGTKTRESGHQVLKQRTFRCQSGWHPQQLMTPCCFDHGLSPVDTIPTSVPVGRLVLSACLNSMNKWTAEQNNWFQWFCDTKICFVK